MPGLWRVRWMESDGERVGVVCQDHRVHRAGWAVIEEWDSFGSLIAPTPLRSMMNYLGEMS